MTLRELIQPECVIADLSAVSKKQLFQDMAQNILDNNPDISEAVNVRDIVNAAIERERLGSTGVGSGIALPHARVDGLDRVYACLARLETPLEYDAIDGRDVDIAILLVAPSDAGGEHLRALAQVSRRLRRQELRARLRAAPSSESLYISFLDTSEASAA